MSLLFFKKVDKAIFMCYYIDDDYTTLWALGKFVNDEFQVNCWLGESYIDDFKIPEYIDLSQANETMIWT